jgi:hypothetical protein
MTRPHLALLVLLAGPASLLAAEPGHLPIALEGLRGDHAAIAAAAGGATVAFTPAEWSNAVLDFKPAADWRPFGHLVLTLENPGDRPLDLGVRLDDDPAADGRAHCLTAKVTVAPKSRTITAVSLGPDPMALGMRGLPGPAGARVVTASGDPKFDPGHVVSVRLFLHRPEAPTSLILESAALAPSIARAKFVDRFGQYAPADWPGKLADESELIRRRDAEASELAASPAMPDRDRFGGWKDGPKLDATGFFRTALHGGKWWLVDPDGRLFVSSGIDCVDPNEATIVAGREGFFAWLPGRDDPLAAFSGHVNNVHRGPVASGRTFDFYRANLRRKYGPDWESAWRETSLKRLPSWGFNTIGNWSSRALYRNGKVPYTATTSVGGDHARVSSGSDYWGQMHDPFDPQFARDADRAAAELARSINGDPFCVGVFVDNELSWGSFDGKDAKGRYGLALGALKAGSESPAHRELMRQLRSKYEVISKLNAAWGTAFATWDALGADGLPKEWNAALRDDLDAFVTSLARRYFETVNAALKKHDPDHLYLGCRFAWKTDEAIRAAAQVCDVVSFNIYKREVDPQEWAFLNDLNKPAIIGEFHVGATDRGMFHTGLVAAADQDERAAVFAGYVRSVLDHPALVGCHWFQYTDQPLTGRAYDGENYNIGFVAVTDTPYPEMLRAARDVHRTMYPRRAGSPAGSAR